MTETENNTNGGPGNEAKTPHVVDFNGTEIRPGLWAVEGDELNRIGNAAYQAGRGERDASASYALGYEAGRVAGRGDSDNELKRMRAALVASSTRVEDLRAALETTHQREMKVAGMLGCAPADVPQCIGTLLRTKSPRESEVTQLREALELASQQQAKLAAALGTEPGEDVLAEVQGVAEILRKSCAALGIHAEHAADLPSEIEKLSGAECDLRAMANWLHIEGDLRPAVRVKVADLIALRNQVVKGLGADAEEHFALVFNRYIDDEVEKRAGRIDAARLRAVAELSRRDEEHAAALKSAVEAAEIRTRKACADQVNAAQACIDRATKEHEEERVKLHARIAKAERDLDESRSALATLDSLRQDLSLRLSTAEAVARGLQGHIDDTIAALGGACGQSAVDLAKRVVRERDESRASHANTVGSLTDFKGIANAQRAELVEIAELTAKQESETFADAVRRVVDLADDKEKMLCAERDATARTIGSLRDAREALKQTTEANNRFVDELRTVLDQRPTEAITEAARRVVAERDALQAKVCTCDTMWQHATLVPPPVCQAHGSLIELTCEQDFATGIITVNTTTKRARITTKVARAKVATAGAKIAAGDPVVEKGEAVMPVVTFGVGQW